MVVIGWLWILLGILLFLLLLLCLPVSIRIGFRDSVTLAVGALGLYFPILPKRKRKINLRRFSVRNYRKLRQKERRRAEKKLLAARENAEKKKKNAETAKKNKEKRLPPEEVSDEPSMLRILLRIVGGILEKFFGKLRVKVLRLHITVGGTDAARIAMTCGIVSQSVAYLLELIRKKTKASPIPSGSVSVVPDFLAAKTTADIEIRFQIRAIDLLSVGLSFVIRFLQEKSAGKSKSSGIMR